MKIGIYVRVSTLDQKDNYSFQQQEADGIVYAASMGHPYKIYKEAASGRKKTREEREQFDKLWKDVEEGRIQAVWIGKADRFTRDTSLGLQFLNAMQRHNCRFIIATKEYDLNDPGEYFMLTVLFGVAKMGGDNIVKSGKAGLKTMQDAGDYRFARLFGYRWKIEENAKLNKHSIPEKTWYVDEDEAKIIRRIYAMFFKGYSFFKIMNEINAAGIPSRYGSKWTVSQITRLLKKPQYSCQQYNSKGNLIDSNVYRVPIVTKEEFDQVQKQWRTVRISQPKTFRRSDWMSASLVQCAYCHAPYIHKYNKRAYGKQVYSWYVAKHAKDCAKPKDKKVGLSIDADVLDHFFGNLYTLAMANPEFLEYVFESLRKKFEEDEEGLTDDALRAREAYEKVKTEKWNFFKLVSGRGPDADANKFLDELEDKIKVAEAKVYETQGGLDMLRKRLEEVKSQFMLDNIAKFQESPNVLKRKMLEGVVEYAYFKERWLHICLIGGIKFVWDIDQPFDGGKILSLIERATKSNAAGG